MLARSYTTRLRPRNFPQVLLTLTCLSARLAQASRMTGGAQHRAGGRLNLRRVWWCELGVVRAHEAERGSCYSPRAVRPTSQITAMALPSLAPAALIASTILRTNLTSCRVRLS